MEWAQKDVQSMITELIFATGNANKVSEIQSILGPDFLIKSLKDINFTETLSEPFDTLEANARTKAEQLREHTGQDCFAEDSGLFVDSLNGQPGVRSARYSGKGATDGKNIDLLLQNLEHKKDRSAFFKTVIHLIRNGAHYQFTGICKGHIAISPVGKNGFGYDPIFIAQDIPDKTFAELTKEEKNSISHRAMATNDFVKWLVKQDGSNR